jgi:predicted Rossmann fold flavoprotein
MIDEPIDIAIVGAGAAGLATAIFARRRCPTKRVVVFEGARSPGAKILVSGGSRCNVTNTIVTEQDFNGGRAGTVRRILRSMPVADTVRFFNELGVTLHEEADGKLFPDSNRSRDVLNALLREVARVGAELRASHRILDVTRRNGVFDLDTNAGRFRARSVVLATGGLSLPKSGSDGAGYGFAARFGHTIVPTTPALVPLMLEQNCGNGFDPGLRGVAQHVRLDVRIDGAIDRRIEGPLLWTHFGVSGPAALDASRHWLRARLEGRSAAITANLLAGTEFDAADARFREAASETPRATIRTFLARLLPASVASTVMTHAGLVTDVTLAALTRDDRRRLVHALVEWPLPILDSRGYNYAEVTAGGVALPEANPATMESRMCPGLFLVGEILDVDGRLGGFNFQWAWATGKVAGDALAAA